MPHRHRIQFPPVEAHNLDQDEAYFYVYDRDHADRTKLRFHDYGQIYRKPGLYEQLFYDRLKCVSPKKVSELLKRTLDSAERNLTELRVLDLGAGNGMMGEVLKNYGVARMVGADIIPEACEAAYRDRPGVYDDYYVADFTNLDQSKIEDLQEWSFDCLTCVAALGFGDIPPKAFAQALHFIKPGGWVAFNIKETFLDHSDTTGFSKFVREMILSEFLDVYHIEKYQHRLSIEGQPLFYAAVVAEKTAEIPDDFLRRHEIDPFDMR